jgi:polysaccharide pyruvyl transferase WcaK-like protein
VRIKRVVRSRFPRLLEALLTWGLKRRKQFQEAEAVKSFARTLERSDLLLICGAGGFYDGCPWWSLPILELIEEAIQRDVPVALLGQGFGPISDVTVLNRARKVLPLVNFMTLRGNRGAFSTLRSLGIPESKLEITGDEALEIAYDARSNEIGRCLGINLRFGGSASTDDADLETVRSVLYEFTKQRNISLIPLPISIQEYNRDDLAIKLLLKGLVENSDGGGTLDSPLKVIEQVKHCRIVVTGAYHAAVFALGQGIPVVGIAKSDYYASKFWGLEDQFGEGCQTILLNGPEFPQKFHRAIETAWQNAERLREPLLVAASGQIEASQRSYQRLKNLVA